MELDTHELAWAAGFFDGEGCTSCSVARHNKRGREYVYLTIHLAISQANDPGVLERFQKAVGGLGSIGKPRSRPQGWGDIWTFYGNGFERTQAIVAMLWPWLSPVKRAQATRALVKYLAAGNRSGRRLARKAPNVGEQMAIDAA